MRIAVFSDVHSNYHALQSVLSDIESQVVDKILCLGDLVGYGAFPNEVIQMLSERKIPTVLGNYDEAVGLDLDDCGCEYKDPELDQLGKLSLAWTQARTSPANKANLHNLLPNIRLEVNDKRILAVHGGPRKINEFLYEDRQQITFERIARNADVDVLFCGHTHLPYQKKVADVLFVNAGSVGKPKDGDPRAGYVIVDFSGNYPQATFRRVEYDLVEAMAAIRSEPELPDFFAEQLERARD